MKIEISEHELDSLLVYALRYALGRTTGATLQVQNIIKRQFDLCQLEEQTIKSIIMDIETELRVKSIHACEVGAWEDLVKYIQDKE